jgi:hypothetical protein
MSTSTRSRIVYTRNLKKRILRETAMSVAISIPPAIIEQAVKQYTTSLDQSTINLLNGRLERGITMVKAGAVTPTQNPRCFRVRSSSGYDSYLVNLDKETCECPDHWKGHLCKHRIAAGITEIAMQLQEAEAQKAPAKVEAPTPPPTKPQSNRETIVWAVIKHNDKWLGVEVLNFNGDEATVRALPIIKEGNKLCPQFPFADGKSSLDIVPKTTLVHVTEFQ